MELPGTIWWRETEVATIPREQQVRPSAHLFIFRAIELMVSPLPKRPYFCGCFLQRIEMQRAVSLHFWRARVSEGVVREGFKKSKSKFFSLVGAGYSDKEMPSLPSPVSSSVVTIVNFSKS